MFQNERLGGGAVISKKAAETKDLQLLLSFFDYLFGEEGALLKTMGLNAEQAEGNSLYEEKGFPAVPTRTTGTEHTAMRILLKEMRRVSAMQ